MQHLANNAGYFFKCPMCNNKDEFEEEMKRFGIYVPEQDAAWEREGNTFAEIYERHGTCDAEECQCPDGREYDVDYTIWEIVSDLASLQYCVGASFVKGCVIGNEIW